MVVTSTNFGQPKPATPDKSLGEEAARQACIAKGGRWNYIDKTCEILPKITNVTGKPVSTNTDNETTKPKTTEVFRDSKTGKPSGVTLPDGRTFLGLSPDDVEKIAKSEQEKVQLPEGTQPVGTTANAIEAQRVLAQQLGAVGTQSPGLLGTEVLGQNNLVENIGTGAAALAGAAVGVKGGAAAGAAIGSIVPIIGNAAGGVAGGVIGGIVGAIGGAVVKLSAQERQNVKKANKIFTTAKSNKDRILNQVNSGLLTESAARTLWAEEKSNIALAHSYLKQQTQNDLKDFLGNPGDELIAVESYIALDTLYDVEFEKALIAPNPNRITFIPPENLNE